MKTQDIENRLIEKFNACKVAVFDMTAASDNFEIRLATPDLKDLSRVERHQAVMALFAEELKSGEIHALSIKYLK